MAVGRITLAPLTDAEVTAVTGWRYPAPYGVYDLHAGDGAALTDPANRFLAIREDDRLIGHVCVGVEARVPGLTPVDGVDDVGVGIDPSLVGRGRARAVLPVVLAALGGELRGPALRVAVAAWNERAQAAARAAGFAIGERHENDNGVYVLMTRAWP